MTAKTAALSEALLLEIAAKHFFLETLETRRSDSLDFHDVAIWAMRAALEDAYEAGRIAGAKAMLAAATAARRKDQAMTINTIRNDVATLPGMQRSEARR